FDGVHRVQRARNERRRDRRSGAVRSCELHDGATHARDRAAQEPGGELRADPAVADRAVLEAGRGGESGRMASRVDRGGSVSRCVYATRSVDAGAVRGGVGRDSGDRLGGGWGTGAEGGPDSAGGSVAGGVSATAARRFAAVRP